MARITQTGFGLSKVAVSKKGFQFQLVGASKDGLDLLGAKRPSWQWGLGNRCKVLP